MIAVEKLSLRQGAFHLDGVSFSVPTGRYAVLMGKTGSGKSSILEAICGLRPIIGGRIVLDGRDVTRLRPGERGIGYVPQDGALFPTHTVRDHLAFALGLRKFSLAQIEERVRDLAGWLGVTHLLDRYPEKLSGGEAQRVALGRAISFLPTVLVLDEPLSALDEGTRGEMYELLERLRSSQRMTVLHVTHSRAEADQLGDLVIRIEKGSAIVETER